MAKNHRGTKRKIMSQAVVKYCVDCKKKMPKGSQHHLRCNRCWIKFQEARGTKAEEMMKEPLRNKDVQIINECIYDNELHNLGIYDNITEDLYLKESVKSAVEWLKETLGERLPMSKGFYKGDKEDIILTTIAEAFPDLNTSSQTNKGNPKEAKKGK